MKKRQHKTLWAVILVVCIVIALVCIGTLLWLHFSEQATERQLEEAVIPQEDPVPVVDPEPEPEPLPAPVAEPDPEPEPEPELIPADVPIDFAYLQEINADIYGWLDLTCTEQGYPVLSNEADPDYYLHRDINGAYASAGSLYSQSTFNGTDFSDPCTLIYGHNMNSGAMFGKLQRTASQRDLDDPEDDNYFTLYTPTKRETYRIWASGVFSNQNVLYYFDFSDEDSFNEFFETFETYPQGAHYVSSDFRPEFGDEIVILSTCYSMNNTYRFLTIGVMTEKEGY